MEQRRLHTISNRHVADWVAWNTGASEQSRDENRGAASCISCAREERRSVKEEIKSPGVLRKTREID